MRTNTKNILIDKKFLNNGSKLSIGLISGLKELTLLGYSLHINDFNPGKSPELAKVFKLEGIKILSENGNEKGLIISTTKQGPGIIKVGSKGKIKNFGDAVNEIKLKMRSSEKVRITKETNIKINVALDGDGRSKIKTGIGFFDHMLEQIARHANINLDVKVKGDLHIDEHHTVEDVGITLGIALNDALGDKKGIQRYGFFLPMDDSAAICSIDLGGRTFLNFNCKFNREKVGEFPTELTEEFFRALASGLKANIFIKATGKNDHHKIEGIFKAFAKSLNEACRFDERNSGRLPSTKGIL